MEPTQLSLIALEPCKHCGGNAIRKDETANGLLGEYQYHRYECDTCTFSTDGTFGAEMQINAWNKGVPVIIAMNRGLHDYYEGTADEIWEFLCRYMNHEKPKPRQNLAA